MERAASGADNALIWASSWQVSSGDSRRASQSLRWTCSRCAYKSAGGCPGWRGTSQARSLSQLPSGECQTPRAPPYTLREPSRTPVRLPSRPTTPTPSRNNPREPHSPDPRGAAIEPSESLLHRAQPSCAPPPRPGQRHRPRCCRTRRADDVSSDEPRQRLSPTPATQNLLAGYTLRHPPPTQVFRALREPVGSEFVVGIAHIRYRFAMGGG